MMAGLRKAIVVATHPEDHSCDLVMCDDGSRLTGVPIMAQSASARSGSVDLPEVKKTGDKWDITQRDGQDMEVLVGFMGRGNPIVVGFLYPQISQMTFKDKQRRFSRHQSDVYTTIDGNGNVELYHPSGAFVRIAEEDKLAHEDLEKKNFDESLQLDRNKDKKVAMRMSLGGVVFEIKGGVVTITGKVVVSGDVVAGGVSLTTHTHSGVKKGGDTSGPPVAGSLKNAPSSGDGGGDGGGTGGGSGGGDTFVPQRDAYGNLVQWDGNGNYYVQNQRVVTVDTPNGPVTTVVPDGDKLYTDASGNVLSSVVLPGNNSLYIDANGQLQQSPDTTIAQTVPTGDPLPGNENKG